MKKILLFILFITMLPLIYASPQWLNVGNAESNDAGGVDYWYWASGYTGGNINFTYLTGSTANNYQPIVDRPLDLSSFSSNYIYTFSTNAIVVINGSNGAEVTTFSLANICGQPILINYQADSDKEIALIAGNGSAKALYIIEMNDNVLSVVKNITVVTASTCVIDSNHPFNSTWLGSALTTGSVERINIDTNVIDTIGTTVTFAESQNYDTSYNIFSRPLVFDDISGDGFPDFIVAGRIAGNIRTQAINGQTGSILWTDDTGCSNAVKSIRLSVVQIGASGSSKEILMQARASNFAEDANVGCPFVIYSTSGSELFSSPNLGASSSNKALSASVADFDYNGLNELCFTSHTDQGAGASVNNISCYSSNYNSLFNISIVTTSETNPYHYFSIGEYDQNMTYMEFIFADAVKRLNFNGTAYSFTDIYNLTADNFAYFYPVSLLSRTNFTKDILYSDFNILDIYQSEGIPTVCGNLICELGETLATCPVDCQDQEVEPPSGDNLPVGSYCTNSSACASGKCLYRTCELKVEREICSSDSQCLSGDCDANTGRCTKASLWKSLNAGKEEAVGDDTETNIFFSLFIIIVIDALIVTAGVGAHHALASAGIAGVVTILMVFFFALVGWLPGYFAFIAFFALIVLIASIAYLMRGSD